MITEDRTVKFSRKIKKNSQAKIKTLVTEFTLRTGNSSPEREKQSMIKITKLGFTLIHSVSVSVSPHLPSEKKTPRLFRVYV